MRISTKILGMAAAATIIATGTAAFTGAGMVTTNSAAESAFIGGKVSQSVTGGALSNIAYRIKTGSNGQVDQITLTFVDVPAGTPVTAELSGTWTAADGFLFTNVNGSNQSTGTPALGTEAAPTGYITDLSGIEVTVHGDEITNP